MTNALAIILARAGSKGVPGKNLADVGGRPALEWSIRAALDALPPFAIFVSSDAPDALALATRLGVGALHRPAELATDTARIDDAARAAVGQLEARGSVELIPARPIVILYANVPIRPAGLIARALALLASTHADSVQSYGGVGKFHPWWTARLDPESGRVSPWEGDVLNHNTFRRQDLPPAFVPDGGVLVVTRRALFLEISGVAPGPHAFFGSDRRGIINPEGSVIDIDTPEDLALARLRVEASR